MVDYYELGDPNTATISGPDVPISSDNGTTGWGGPGRSAYPACPMLACDEMAAQLQVA